MHPDSWLLLIIVLFIAIFGVGVRGIVSGKYPELLTGEDYFIPKKHTKTVGAVLIFPLAWGLFADISSSYLSLILGETITKYIASGMFVFILFIVSLVIVRIFRKPISKKSVDDDNAKVLIGIEKDISKLANESLLYTILSFTFIFTVFYAPFAIYKSNKVIKLINEHDKGYDFKNTATISRALSIGLLIFVIGLAIVGYVSK